jgi:hypothetical protein
MRGSAGESPDAASGKGEHMRRQIRLVLLALVAALAAYIVIHRQQPDADKQTQPAAHGAGGLPNVPSISLTSG